MRRHLLSGTGLGLVSIVLAMGGAAAAQQTAPTSEPAAAPDNGGITEVIVTAQKHNTAEQKTPIALTVMTSETLKSNGVGNLKDLTSILPSVSFAQQNASVIIGIRGVSSRDTTNPTVSLSYDGFYTQVADGLNMSMFDLERVEVLRGPQGTLAGRNATAGAVNVITAKPGKFFGGYISGEVGDYNTFNTTGAVDIPLTDSLRVRAAFQTRDHDGYRSNSAATDKRFDGDDEHTKSARLHIAYEPTDKWKSLLTLEATHLDDVGPVVQAVPQVYTSTGAVVLTRPSIPGDGKTFPVAPGGFERGDSYAARWTTSYDFGFATLTYLGGYRDFIYRRTNTLGGQYGTDRQNFSFSQKEGLQTWNHEIRLTSMSQSPLFWQVGGFLFNESNSVDTRFQDFRNSQTLLEAPTDLQIFIYPNERQHSSAVFGQASYDLTSKLKVELGARYTWDVVARDGYQSVTSLPTYLSTGAISYATSSTAGYAPHSKATYHAGLDWQWSARNMAYVKYDTGYKGGGFNIGYPAYGPETIESWEIGSKNRFWDNRIQLNIDAYTYKYDNQQVTIAVAGLPSSPKINAGTANYWGVEAEGTVRFTPVDKLNGYIGYNNAKYAAGTCLSFTVTVTCAAGQDVSGLAPPQAPLWTVNLCYQHDFSAFGGTLTPRIQSHYESKSYYTVYNFDADSQPAYTRSDLLVTYTPESGEWSLQGYVRNIEDVLVLANAQNPSSTTYKAYRYQYQPPRTVGIKLTKTW